MFVEGVDKWGFILLYTFEPRVFEVVKSVLSHSHCLPRLVCTHSAGAVGSREMTGVALVLRRLRSREMLRWSHHLPTSAPRGGPVIELEAGVLMLSRVGSTKEAPSQPKTSRPQGVPRTTRSNCDRWFLFVKK